VSVAVLDPFLIELLNKIAEAADPTGKPAAEARLYTTPTAGAEPEFDEEWTELIQPDLQEYFATSVDIVQGDLLGFPSTDSDSPETALQIPIAHLEAWVHALNQARLALAAQFNVSEEDMNDLPLGGDVRALGVFQIHFYGFLQECFLRLLDDAS
jgi:hypothetical protein